jgi:lipoate-protein ligase A
VLRTDEEKIRSKALRSIRSRVENIAPYTPWLGAALELRDELKKIFFETLEIREYELTDEDITQIGNIRREKYANPDWTFGRTPRFSFHNRKRFPMGNVEVFLEVKGGVISSCRINGDFLGLAPIRDLEGRLEAKPYERRALEEALSPADLGPLLGGITQEQLLLCLFP